MPKRCSKCGVYEDEKGMIYSDPKSICFTFEGFNGAPEPNGDHDWQEEGDCPICGEAKRDCSCRAATCECGHLEQDHYPGTEDCDVKTCRCRKFKRAHGPDSKDFYPTEAELTIYNGPQ